jgi:hypothetical protein
LTPSISPPTGGTVNWVTKNNSTKNQEQERTKNNNNKHEEEESEKQYNKRSGKREHVCRGGPTTEAGRRKMEEKEAAKAEKEWRKKEKNRKKRQTYRESKRAKQCDPSAYEGMDWTKKNKKGRPGKNKQEQRKEKQKKEKEMRDRKMEETDTFNECRWGGSIAKALRNGDFDSMRRLFKKYLRQKASGASVTSSGMRSLVTKRFRALSTKYHPDKHASAGADPSIYKVAFQALKEARVEVLRKLTDQ